MMSLIAMHGKAGSLAFARSCVLGIVLVEEGTGSSLPRMAGGGITQMAGTTQLSTLRCGLITNRISSALHAACIRSFIIEVVIQR